MARATISAGSATATLPGALRRALGRLDRRIRASSAMRGLGMVSLVVALVAAAGMAGDFAWALPQVVRWAIWAAWLGAGIWGLGRLVLRPLSRTTDPLVLAAIAERSRPEVGERLTGAVGLLGPGRAHGSPALIAALVDEASARVDAIDPVRAVSLRQGTRWLAAGLMMLGLVAAPGVVWAGPFRSLVWRFLAPWANLERVDRLILTVRPGDRVVALGDELTISATVRARFGGQAFPDEAWLEWDDAGGARRVAMGAGSLESGATPGGAERPFSVVLPSVASSLSYRVVCGSAASRTYRVKAVEPPRVAALSARVEPPEYTKAPATLARDPSKIDAWEGSRVTLEVSAGRPLRSIEIDWPRASGPVEASLGSDRTGGKATLVAEASGGYGIRLLDDDGLASRPEALRRLVVRADAPPALALRESEQARDARPDDTLRVDGSARDDVAVASVELHYSVRRAGARDEEVGTVSAAWKGLGSPSARGRLELPLERLKLKPGDTLAYRVRVVDNRPAPKGPNVTWSSPSTLAIVAEAESLSARQSRTERQGWQARLDALKAAAAVNRKETELLRYAADAAQRGNGSWGDEPQQALERREAEARAEVDRLQVLARDFAADPRLHTLARPARQVAEVEAEAGRALLEQAMRPADASRRFADLRQADARLAAVSRRLEDLQHQFDALTRRDVDHQRLEALADREGDIAKKATEDATDPAQLRAEQAAVQEDLETLLKSSPELRAEVLAAQAEEARALAARARDLAARQRKEAQDATELEGKGGELRALAEAQRALEDDARRLALEVDDPLAENGRGRLDVGALQRAVEPLARGDFDQARQRLETAEAELRRLTGDLENLPGDLKALVARLAKRQEALGGQAIEAVRKLVGSRNPTIAELARLTEALRPLADRQQAIVGLLDTIRASEVARPEAVRKAPLELAEAAARGASRASEMLRSPNPSQVRAGLDEASRDLKRLAEALPGSQQLQARSRQRSAEAARESEAVGRELETLLRGAGPVAGRPFDPAAAAEALAARLAPLAERQARVAEAVAGLDVETRVEPQRDRAGRRARALAEALKAIVAKETPPSRRQTLIAHVRGARADALASLGRLSRKLQGGTSADDLADELAVEQDALRRSVGRPEARAKGAAEQRRVALALRALDVPDVSAWRDEAIHAADRAALALADPASTPDPGTAVGVAVEATRALADRLADRLTPRARAQALARAQRALDGPGMDADPAGTARRQRAIFDDLARIPLDEKAVAEEATLRAVELAEQGLQGGPTPGSSKPGAAALAGARARAAEAIEALAARAPAEAARPGAKPAEVVSDPELGVGPRQAGAAGELARRERRIRERLQSLLGERAGPQHDLSRESAALGRQVADLRERGRPLGDQGQGPAQEAAQLLGEQAPRAMDQGAEQLAQARPSAARDAQRRAAELAERGAQRVEDLAAALRSALPADAKDAPPSPLDAAREAMRQAARQLEQAQAPAPGPEAAHAAQQAMARAAQGLHAAAQGQGQDGEAPGSEPRDGAPSDGPAVAGPARDPQGKAAGKAAPDLEELKGLVRSKSGRKWGELPGHLRSEILQMSNGRYRDDYARLIQLYFREIAADADKPR